MPIPPGTPGKIRPRAVAIPIWRNNWKDAGLYYGNLPLLVSLHDAAGVAVFSAPATFAPPDAPAAVIALLPVLAAGESLRARKVR